MNLTKEIHKFEEVDTFSLPLGSFVELNGKAYWKYRFGVWVDAKFSSSEELQRKLHSAS